MAKYLHINIPESCHENWNEMLPSQQGRHCLSCQKTVVDFTGMTDTELISFFTKQKGNTCGRFTNDQLQRSISIPKKKANWVKYFFQIALPAFFLSSKVAAQADTAKPAMEIRDSAKPDIQTDTIIPRSVDSSIVVNDSTLLSDSLKVDTLKIEPFEFKLPTMPETITYEIMGNMITTTGFCSFPVNEMPISQVGMFPRFISNIFKKKEPLPLPPVLPNIPQPSIATLFPNPIKSGTTLHINWENAVAGTYQFNISNSSNNIVQQGEFNLEENSTESSIVLQQLPEGNYVLNILHSATQEKFIQDFIIL